MISTFLAKGVVGVAQNHNFLELAYKGTLGQDLHHLHPTPQTVTQDTIQERQTNDQDKR